MSINDQPIINQPTTPSPSPSVPVEPTHNDPQTNNLGPVNHLTDILQSVDTKSPEAKLNATSITDAQGNRIVLNDQTTSTVKSE